MGIFSLYGLRTKVPKEKDKMSSGGDEATSQQQQQQQQQIPNIAGTIVDPATNKQQQHYQHHHLLLQGAFQHPTLLQSQQQQHPPPQHAHHHHMQHLHPFSSSVTGGSTGLLSTSAPSSTLTSGSKMPIKTVPIGPSPFRQLLPVALCIISFATVLSILIIYMDTTEIRHQQFRLNMSRDYDLMGVPQDNPALVKYVRDIHMKKYPMTFMRNANAPTEHLNFTNRHELTPEMAHFISDLLGKKRFGTFFQSLAGFSDSMMTAPWLAETMNWGGYLVEPDPRKYFSLRKQNAFRPNVQVIHACLSPNTYPKEVTLHHDDDSEVRINSVLDEETEWFHPRVKCFPVYTLMLAVNRTSIDLLSLGCQGQELQILQTIPFEKVHIKVISIHLVHYYEEDELIIDVEEYVQNITRFLLSKSYKLVRTYDRNFIYQYINSGLAAGLSRVNSLRAGDGLLVPSHAAGIAGNVESQQDTSGSSVGTSIANIKPTSNKIRNSEKSSDMLGKTAASSSGGTTMAAPIASAPPAKASKVAVLVGSESLETVDSKQKEHHQKKDTADEMHPDRSTLTSAPPMVTSL